MQAYINKIRNKGPRGINISETEDLVNECSEVMCAMRIFSTGTERDETQIGHELYEDLSGDEADIRTNIMTAAQQQANSCNFNSHYGLPSEEDIFADEDF